MKQLSLKLDDHLYEKLQTYTRDNGVSASSVLTDSLVAHLSRQKRSNAPQGNFTFIDLFAGIGGMRIAYSRQGGQCVFSSEWDKYAQKTYFDNFDEMPQGDITQVKSEDIPDHDILVAGFPCQPFSIAGVSKKNSMGRATGFQDKTQGTLFFDVCRIIEAKRPKAFMLENVKNLKSHDKGNTWKVIRESLDQLDYEVFAAVIDGQGFVPQHRERIFIVGFDRQRYGNFFDFSFDVDEDKPEKVPVLRDILQPVVDAKYTLTDKLWAYLQNYAAKHKAKGNGFGYGMPDFDGVTRTLSARYYKDGSEILINQGEGKNPRRLTPRECARLQGYPEDFKITVSDTRAYKQFGNSVVVPLVTSIAKLVVEKMNELDAAIEGDKKANIEIVKESKKSMKLGA
ncbi:DNA (cytosine-5-)-methyltransferase [Selenomonas sp. WCA-380-WT-3B 3/]|uniref:Cytosine-specific methyltransferase n=1 Tax=Selenomonas montiformis TaxID=2652285 RepID=A0A6I2V1Z2_9FIRM|nr:DNA (cytosine-5-)-methyltransferase [Selenomonas montiformis]MSV25646.1 DNA (cytosine-5-)-methyltransferase [Selenomonas montiformis]